MKCSRVARFVFLVSSFIIYVLHYYGLELLMKPVKIILTHKKFNIARLIKTHVNSTLLVSSAARIQLSIS